VTGNESGSPGQLPLRRMRDANMVRALAHPSRIRLMEELAFSGPMTATELAGRVGESAANCSWHLRQLARYGFVEEAGGGAGRRRPWQVVLQRNEWQQEPDDAELAAAGNAAANVILSRELEALDAWRAAEHASSPEWRDVPFITQSMGWLTAEELTQAGKEITAVVTRYLHRVNDPASRPAGGRPIRFMAWGIPAVAYETPHQTPALADEAAAVAHENPHEARAVADEAAAAVRDTPPASNDV
jgi:DNA-binding transcriptional ArsR family regulator